MIGSGHSLGTTAYYSVDSVRIDTVKHVRKDFWPGFASSSDVYTIGEIPHNETNYVAGYTRKSVLQFNLLLLSSPARHPQCRS